MQDKHAVLLLLGLAVAGHGVRLLLAGPSEAPGEILAETGPSTGPAAHRERAMRLARPIGPGETIDLNTASAEEIDRLPRIGMSLAKRIVAHRIAHGGFGSLSDLERVAGVGPALLNQLQGKVRFGGGIRQVSRPAPRDPSQPGHSTYGAVRGRIDLNSASEAELVTLPGIGPVRARAILAYRREKGPFAAVSGLRAVPGLTRRLVDRLGPLVTVK